MSKYKTFTAAVCLGLVFSVLCGFIRFEAGCEDIRSNVLRLHILANSDSEADQALKLLVRDELLKVGAELFEEAGDLAKSEQIARENVDLLQRAAEGVIIQNGYDYPVKISFGRESFNTRVYENVTLPAGEYEAVQVIIGEGEGKNWWCVMFPPMCLPASSRELSEVVGEDGVRIAENPDDYVIKFKAFEIIEKIRSCFANLLT